VLRRAFSRWSGDPALVLAVMLLTGFGIAMIYSAGVLNIPSPVTEGAWLRQTRWFAIALVAFTAVRQVRSRWFEWISVPAYALSLVLLAVTLVVGTGSGTAAGVKSFLDLGFIRFQPAELAKLATILALARYLGTRPEDPTTLRALVTPSLIVGLPLGLVILQPDLGTALAFVGILFAALFWAGTPIGLLVLLASPGVALILAFEPRIWAVFFVLVLGSLYFYRYRLFLVESLAVLLANLAAGTIAPPLWNSLADYQQNRILVFLDPSVDPRGAGYHLIQSMVAIGSGGLSGKGFTEGTQKRLDFLPEQHTDFIFSVIGEELGFLGTGLTLSLFSFIVYR
jgi:rod shape determining protein RodA